MNNLSATNKLQDGKTHFASLLTFTSSSSSNFTMTRPGRGREAETVWSHSGHPTNKIHKDTRTRPGRGHRPALRHGSLHSHLPDSLISTFLGHVLGADVRLNAHRVPGHHQH